MSKIKSEFPKLAKRAIITKQKSIGMTEQTPEQEIASFIEELNRPLEEPISENKKDSFLTNWENYSISFIEFAVLNEYLHNVYLNKSDELIVTSYGQVDSVGRITFNGYFNSTNSWWFQCRFPDSDNDLIFSTKVYMDGRNSIINEFCMTTKNSVDSEELEGLFKKIKSLAFNNSKYVGKCIKVKLKNNSFSGIEIIDMTSYMTELVLTDIQLKYMHHFINRVEKDRGTRYLYNGEPGTGKTETIREIIRTLLGKATFIIPDFSTTDDLTVILEACEIFNRGVIILDDMDLIIGSRDKGSYTSLLGQFLSFFDGVKKRKISLLASTNDKGLVDKAAERPGRFNITIDYTYLTPEQIVRVCNIHLPVKYQVKEIYDVLTNNINGKKTKITGAFIANIADNIKEMSDDDANWGVSDTIELIEESYRGFYSSQNSTNTGIGFKTD